MATIKTRFIRIVAGAIFVSVFWFGPAYCLTDEQIFIWTAQMMNVNPDVPKPQIHWVDRAELRAVFVENNRKSYLRWESQMGQEKAQKVMDLYLKEIVGLFETKSGAIYIGTFLDACRRKAILAHEYTHFFQVTYRGPIADTGEEAEATMNLAREMEAYKLEGMFTETFCHSDELQAAAKPIE